MDEGENTVTRDEFEDLLIQYEKDIYAVCLRLGLQTPTTATTI